MLTQARGCTSSPFLEGGDFRSARDIWSLIRRRGFNGETRIESPRELLAGRRRRCIRVSWPRGSSWPNPFPSQVHTWRPRDAWYISPDDASLRPAMPQPCLAQRHTATLVVGGHECRCAWASTMAVPAVDEAGSGGTCSSGRQATPKMTIIPSPFHTRRPQATERRARCPLRSRSRTRAPSSHHQPRFLPGRPPETQNTAEKNLFFEWRRRTWRQPTRADRMWTWRLGARGELETLPSPSGDKDV